MKLNLGGGCIPIEGYVELDRKTGQEIYPLDYGDATVAEIRASHCLEHFSHREVGDVLNEWVRALEPGGTLKIAVPDFAKIAQWYVEKRQGLPMQSYILGGQTDENDYHKAMFDSGLLTRCLMNAGLVDIKPWVSEIEDNASWEVSLNLQGTKPMVCASCGKPTESSEIVVRDGDKPQPVVVAEPERQSEEKPEPVKIIAVASVPRLGFNATWHCTLRAMLALGIKLEMSEGAFWDQCLTRGIEKALEQKPDIILTIDYDTVFDVQHVIKLCQLLADNPDFDIAVPVQMKRECDQVLMQMNGSRDFTLPLTPIKSGHFGLTAFDAAAFEKIPKPWIMGIPSPAGDWGDGHVDPDMFFWQQCAKAKIRVGLANEVRVGHLELGISWPSEDYTKVQQSITGYREKGQPAECGGALRVEAYAAQNEDHGRHRTEIGGSDGQTR